MMKIFAGLCFLIIVLASCGDKPAVIDKRKMQAVLWDMIQLDAYSQKLLATDSIKKDTGNIRLLQEKIFSLHGITREQYIVSYTYYNDHPEYMLVILDSITTRAQANRNYIMQKRYGDTSARAR